MSEDGITNLNLTYKQLKAIESFGCIVDELDLYKSKTSDGVEIRTVDPAHVAMMTMFVPIIGDIRLADDKFIPIDITDVRKVLRFAKWDSPIQIIWNQEKHRITYEFLTNSSVAPCYMRLIGRDDAMSLPKMPNLTLKGMFTVGCEYFRLALSQIDDFSSESVIVEVRADGLVVLTGRSGQGELEETIENVILNNGQVTGMEKGTGVRAIYPLDYLFGFVKKMKTFGTMTMNFGTDYPCVISGAANGCPYTYMLAPRIESDKVS